MDEAARIVCHTFLQQHQLEKEKYLAAFTPEAKQQILNAPIAFHSLTTSVDKREILQQIHPSWIAAALRPLSTPEMLWLLSALDKTLANEVKQQLGYNATWLSLSVSAQELAVQRLYALLSATSKPIPFECLPTSPLMRLWSLPYPSLQKLVSLLGMYDVEGEMKKIIDNAKLQALQKCLTAQQVAFLKQRKGHPIGPVFKEMGLAQATLEPSALQQAIYARGLNRIAKALYSTHPSFKWFITHRFSIQEERQIDKLCQPLDHERNYQILCKQILETIEML